MIYIHDNEVNHISECNLPHDIIHPPKYIKTLNIHYYPIMNECMHTRNCRLKFKTFQILLDRRCSSMIVTERLVEILRPEKDAGTQCHTQAENITTSHKVKINFI